MTPGVFPVFKHKEMKLIMSQIGFGYTDYNTSIPVNISVSEIKQEFGQLSNFHMFNSLLL